MDRLRLHRVGFTLSSPRSVFRTMNPAGRARAALNTLLVLALGAGVPAAAGTVDRYRGAVGMRLMRCPWLETSLFKPVNGAQTPTSSTQSASAQQ